MILVGTLSMLIVLPSTAPIAAEASHEVVVRDHRHARRAGVSSSAERVRPESGTRSHQVEEAGRDERGDLPLRAVFPE